MTLAEYPVRLNVDVLLKRRDDILDGKPGRAVADIVLLLIPLKGAKGGKAPKPVPKPEIPVAPKPVPKPPVKPPWEPPAGLRLPAAERGTWTGTSGNSAWVPNDPARFGLKPGQSIPFREGVPDFRQFAHPTPSGKPGVFDVPGLTGSPKGDYNLAVAKIAEQEGMTRAAVREWLRENDLQIHHYTGTEMQLVPAPTHGVAHQGGASELRQPAP